MMELRERIARAINGQRPQVEDLSWSDWLQEADAVIEVLAKQEPAFWGPQMAIRNRWDSLTVRLEPARDTDMPLYLAPGAQAAAVIESLAQHTAHAESLRDALKKANDQAEHFEREWYLRGDEIERLRGELDEIKQVEFPRRVHKVADGWHGKCERLQAEIEAMKQQEPVARYNWHKGKLEWLQKWDFGRMNMQPLYLAPGAQAAVPDKWQPIETAPKDTFLLLRGPSGYTTTPFTYTTGRMCSGYKEGRWIDHANDDLIDWGFKPTHWMPLPEEPKNEQQN